MHFILLGLGALAAFVCTFLSVPFVSRLAASHGWLDKPDGTRKLHVQATPNIGGIAIVAGCVAGLVYLVWAQHLLPFQLSLPPVAVGIGAIAVVCTGIYDDIRGLDFKGKFFIQILVAYLLIHAGYRVDVSVIFPVEYADAYQQALYSIPLTMLWIVGIINAVNLLDGLDGLAAGVSMIAFSALAVFVGLNGEIGLAVLAIPVAAALAGFLLHNFNPASVFMGDSGSLLLGYMLAVFSLEASSLTNSIAGYLAPMVVLGVPVLDTGLSIVRRAARRKPIFAPDADHIHHRLVKRYSVPKAVLILYGAALLFGMVAVVISMVGPVEASILLLLTAGLVCGGLRWLGYTPLKDWRERPAAEEGHDVQEVDANEVGVLQDQVLLGSRTVAVSRSAVRVEELPDTPSDGSSGDASRHVLIVRAN